MKVGSKGRDMQHATESRTFSLIELGGAALGAVLVVVQPIAIAPEYGGWPLALALIPWVLRALNGRPPLKPTPFDFLLLTFVVTAGIGVWAAYNPDDAWHKFWILAAGVVVFYALAGQPPENRWALATGLCGLGAAVTVTFLLTTRWQEQTSDLAILNQFMAWFTGLQPDNDRPFLNTNLFGGLLAMLGPFFVAVGLRAWQERRYRELFWVGVAGIVAAFGLLLSSSRGAWLSLVAALSLWLLWKVSHKITQRRGQSPILIYTAVVALALTIGAIVVTLYPGGLLGLADRLPGAKTGGSRLAVYGQAWELVQDYALTGGGLNSFAGLYSRYELMIPYFVFDYSHNFYLDIVVEQGVFGALAVGLIYMGSLWRLLRFSPAVVEAPGAADQELLRLATLAAFAVVGLHGLMDSALYGERGTPLLFLLPGLSLMLTGGASLHWRDWAKSQAAAATMIFIGLAGFAVFARAQIYADLGAVEMARVELAGFPESNWDRARNPAEFRSACEYLEQARRLDPHNRTAAHRLGMLAFHAGDCEQAVAALEIAAGADPSRRFAKALGYCYTWLGNFERAGALLLRIPEARYEMDIYGRWWKTQNRPDLAMRAAHMERLLAQVGAPLESDPLAAP
jgi:tetratricopeptide (TPR) repeat protein